MESEDKKCGLTLSATDIADWYYGTTEWCTLPTGHRGQCSTIKELLPVSRYPRKLKIKEEIK